MCVVRGRVFIFGAMNRTFAVMTRFVRVTYTRTSARIGYPDAPGHHGTMVSGSYAGTSKVNGQT